MKKRLLRTQIIVEVCSIALFGTSLLTLLFSNNYKATISTLLLAIVALFIDERIERGIKND